MTDINPPLTIEDHWCCHRKCPHIGDGYSCRECKREIIGGEDNERKAMADESKEH